MTNTTGDISRSGIA